MSCKDCNNTDPCKSKDCSCPVQGMTANCVEYKGDDLECSGIKSGTTLDNLIKKLDLFICNSIDSLKKIYNIINIGGGKEIYKGVNNLGEKELRTLKSTDSSVDIVQKNDYIDFSSKPADTKNIGEGSEIFKQVNSNNEKELRTLKSTDNSVKIEQTPTFINIKSYKHKNVGNGSDIYRGRDANGEYKISRLNSDTLSIEEQPDGSTSINTIKVEYEGINRFIVNNRYTGNEEKGSLAQPFKSLDSALNYYVGNGTKDNPEFEGSSIVVQRGDTYEFKGTVSHRGLTLIVDNNATIKSNPVNGWFMDLNPLDENLDTTNNIIINSGGSISLLKNGIRNKGVKDTSSGSKAISIEGEGTIVNGVNNSNFKIIDINSTSDPLYSSGRSAPELSIKGVTIWSYQGIVWDIGGKKVTVYINNSKIRSGMSSYSLANLESFNQTDSLVSLTGCDIYTSSSDTRNKFFSLEGSEPKIELKGCLLQPVKKIKNLFYDNSTTKTSATIVATYNYTRYGNIINIVNDNFNLTTYRYLFNYNVFNTGSIPDNVDLTKNNNINVNNVFDSINIDSLMSFQDKATAQSSGKPKGTKFINLQTNTIDIIT